MAQDNRRVNSRQDLFPQNTQSTLIPRFCRSEVFGFAAGFGTAFAAVPDLDAMLRHP